MSSFPINNTQYLYEKRNGYANYSGATDQNSSVFGIFPIKETTNEDSFVAFESNEKANNSNSETAQLRQSLNETKSKQGFIGKLWDGFKNLTGIGAGSTKAEKAIIDYENGKISKEEMEKAVNGYTEGQKMVVDVVADMASGILAIGAFALAVPTGGASLAVGLGLATAVGAGSKVLIKGGDALLTGKEYSGKDLLYDTVTGGINGILAPVTNGIGNTVTKTIGTKLGLTIVKEGAEEVVEQGVKQGVKQGLKSIVLNQTTDVIGGTVAKRAVALGAGMAVDGALGGAADNMVRAGLNGENVLEAGVQGAVGGLIMAPVVGGGFRVAGKAGKALGNKINTGKTLSSEVATSKIMPDTTPAIVQGGVAPDEKKMMRISLQFFGEKTADEVSSSTHQFKNNLTIFLEDNYVSAKDLGKMLDEYPNMSRNIGTLPDGWVSNNITNYKQISNDVYSAISAFQSSRNIHDLTSALTDALGKNTMVAEIGSGNWGTCYKIEVHGSEPMCLKLFNTTTGKMKSYLHGSHIEPQAGLFLNKHSGEYVKMYFGKISDKFENNGFLVTQFLDEGTIAKKTGEFSQGEYIFNAYDAGLNNNTINGKIIDFGGVEVYDIDGEIEISREGLNFDDIDFTKIIDSDTVS